jgi:hypothetical protein
MLRSLRRFGSTAEGWYPIVEKYFQMLLTRMDEDKFVAISGIVRELITIHRHGLFKGDGSVEDKLEYIAGFWIGISTWVFYETTCSLFGALKASLYGVAL